MAWIIRKNKYMLFASSTSAFAIEQFIHFTKDEPKSLISKAILEHTRGRNSVRVNEYSLKWE
jgi:hypothetical protein